MRDRGDWENLKTKREVKEEFRQRNQIELDAQTIRRTGRTLHLPKRKACVIVAQSQYLGHGFQTKNNLHAPVLFCRYQTKKRKERGGGDGAYCKKPAAGASGGNIGKKKH